MGSLQSESNPHTGSKSPGVPGHDPGMSYDVGDGATLGRGNVEIVLEDPFASSRHARLVREMGDQDDTSNRRSLAVLLVAEGRAADVVKYRHLEAPPPDDPWIARAKAILAEERAAASRG